MRPVNFHLSILSIGPLLNMLFRELRRALIMESERANRADALE